MSSDSSPLLVTKSRAARDLGLKYRKDLDALITKGEIIEHPKFPGMIARDELLRFARLGVKDDGNVEQREESLAGQRGYRQEPRLL